MSYVAVKFWKLLPPAISCWTFSAPLFPPRHCGWCSFPERIETDWRPCLSRVWCARKVQEMCSSYWPLGPESARKEVGGLPASIFSMKVAGETEINFLHFSDWIRSPKLAHKLFWEQLSHSFWSIIFANFWMGSCVRCSPFWNPLYNAISQFLPVFFSISEDILGHAASIRGFKTSLLVGESSVEEATDDLWCFCPFLSSRKLFKEADKWT